MQLYTSIFSTEEYGTNSVLNAVFALIIEFIVLLLINFICNPFQYEIHVILFIIFSGIIEGIGTVSFSVSISTGLAGIAYTIANSISVLQTLQDYIIHQEKPDLISLFAFGLLVLSGLMVIC